MLTLTKQPLNFVRAGVLTILSGCFVSGCVAGPDAWQKPRTTVYHLRSGGATPEWSDFAGTPDGREFSHRFSLEKPPSGEATILLYQDNVKHRWAVEINGKPIGALELQEQPLVSTFTVPPGTLVAGTNTVRVLPPRETEDIRIGWVGYELRPPARALGDCTLEISVLETGRGLVPARVTVVDDAREALAALHVDPDPKLAVRPGVVYTAGGHAPIRLQAGRYTVTASRGFEYGIAQRTVVLEPGDRRAVALEIRREVPTPRLAAADFHVHTRELSGHGDSSVAERLVTLAGEGVEIPVATEHNRHASYVASALQNGLSRHFTAVDGNEVTTPAGHFNVFPVRPGAPVPEAKETHWPTLMKSIAASGAEVVILNHPRGIHSKFVPFGPANFDPATGENLRGFPFEFNAIELVNSGALQSDFRLGLRDWFALLNAGLRVTAVGASDSHDVSRYIVGQGRTYVACRDDDPGAIDLKEAVRAIREGRASVSLGLLTTIRVNERAGIGDLATQLPEDVPVTIDVWGPAWTAVDRVELYANGILVQAFDQPGARTGGKKLSVQWRMKRPPHDVHLVAVAVGPGTLGLHWPMPRPYQPSSPEWTPHVLGIANPVWLDVDNDGRFASARDLASRIVERLGTDPAKVLPAVAACDAAVAAQTTAVLRAKGIDVRSPEWAPLHR